MQIFIQKFLISIEIYENRKFSIGEQVPVRFFQVLFRFFQVLFRLFSGFFQVCRGSGNLKKPGKNLKTEKP